MDFIIIGVIAAGLALFVIGGYNGLVKLRNLVEEAFATMDVYLKKRYDLIPNLVETVKGYAAHEAGTLEKVVQARNMAASAGSMEDRIQGENMLTGALKNLFALAEAYPDLKANTNFMDLQAQLQKVEEDIANSRKYYNATVREYNIKTEVFPYNIIAGLFKFARKPLYEVTEEAERQNVKVKF
ncbi:MAG TPA: LemA family protein [Bacillota bacterium]|jgi:LemA protein|nr:LemA family protein [Bacillota bacterium]